MKVWLAENQFFQSAKTSPNFFDLLNISAHFEEIQAYNLTEFCLAPNVKIEVVATPQYSPQSLRVKAFHSNIVHIVSKESFRLPWEPPNADGLFCAFKNESDCNLKYPAFTIRTADCICLALYSEREGYALVHAGWKGFTTSIVSKALEPFADRSIIKAFISPHIFGSSYDVGTEVLEAVNNELSNNGSILFASEKLKHNSISLLKNFLFPQAIQKQGIDLGLCTILTLLSAGVNQSNIQWFAHNTFESTIFPSFRKATLTQSDNTLRLETTLKVLP